MKIYFQNKVARLKRRNHGNSCKRCPFIKMPCNCPWNTSTIVDCYGKGHWIDGESPDIFCL
jgi:hypothetical protein